MSDYTMPTPGAACEAAFAAPQAMPLGVEFDAEPYLRDLEDIEITDAQKRELLGVIWSIMRSFVELGFDVKRCGQLLPLLAVSRGSDVHSTYSQTETLSKASETEVL